MSVKEKESKKEDKKVSPEKVEKVKTPFFKMETVTSKPQRKYRKGSKYDAIVDAFIASPLKLVKLDAPDIKGNYLSSQIMKRLVVRKLTDTIDVSVLNNETYLEKIEKPKATKV